VIADNLSTHKTQAVRTFLIAHPNVHLHFTPTYASWLNQIELWFSEIQRDLLARGIFTSVADLARKIRRYIRHYNTRAKPIRWRYTNPAHRISSTSASTVYYGGRPARHSVSKDRATYPRIPLLLLCILPRVPRSAGGTETGLAPGSKSATCPSE